MKELDDCYSPDLLERPNQVVLLISKETNPFRVIHEYLSSLAVDSDKVIDYMYTDTHSLTEELIRDYIVVEVRYSLHLVKPIPKSVLLKNKGKDNNVMYFPHVYDEISHVSDRVRTPSSGKFSEIVPELTQDVIKRMYLFPSQALEENSRIHPESTSSVMLLDLIELGGEVTNMYRLDLHIREPKNFHIDDELTLELPVRRYERTHELGPIVNIDPKLTGNLSSGDRDVISLIIYRYGKGK